MKKIYLYIAVYLFLFIPSLPAQEIYFYEGFEGGSIPLDWNQVRINGELYWNVREGAGDVGGGNIGVPDTAAVGTYNATFQKQNFGDTTLLITPPINLEFAVKPELSFYHAQVEWDYGSGQHDELIVFYRQGEDGEWIELYHYTIDTEDWVMRILQLPANSDSTYIGFMGINGWGMGVCIDEVKIVETGEIPKHLTGLQTAQASFSRIAAGTNNNPILRTEFRVYGNTGDFILETFTINSLNTDDDDIKDQGVRLYLTNEGNFNTTNQISPAGLNFTNGVAEFSSLNVNLPTGYSYVWVTYDVEPEAGNLNIADAYIPKEGILANDTLYPDYDHNPIGNRVIYRTIFSDDFDTDKGWSLTGEFEIDIPEGKGGEKEGCPNSAGLPGANIAYTGTKVLGTDLTGLGDIEGNYELYLEDRAYQAISPEINCYYYDDILLNFQRWFNIRYAGENDKATIDISLDNGETWTQIWRNGAASVFASSWSLQSISLPQFVRQESVRLRFTLGPTTGNRGYSGWNIDNFLLTGNYIAKDVGVVAWLYPYDGCGHTNDEEVAVKVKNFGAEPTPMEIPVGFSLDGGENWIMDVIYLSEPIQPKDTITHVFVPKADLSQPGRYDNVIAKTFLEGDQDSSNDEFNTTIFAIPTYEMPHAENFESDDGLWTAYGENVSWEWGEPAGTIIDEAYSGQSAWVTKLAGPYNSNDSSWVISPCYAFPETDYSVIEFWMATDTNEGVDGVSLQYSENEGETWTMLEPFDEELAWNWHTSEEITALDDYFGSGKGWDGQSTGWFRPRIVLPGILSGNDKVKFRFVFAADLNASGYEGVAFDYVQLYEAPHDVGVIAFLEPESECELPEDQEIEVIIKNFGVNTIPKDTNIPVGVDVNVLAPVNENLVLQHPLQPGETVNYTFDTRFDLSAIGEHTITAYTMLPGDTDFYEPGVFNDTLSVNINVFGYPVVDLGEDIYTLQPDTVLLDAGEGLEIYLWQDGHDERYYNVSLPYSYEYSVTVFDDNGCPAYDTLMIIAHDLSVEEITSPVNSCELDDDELISVMIKNVGPDTIAAGTKVPLSLYFNDDFVVKETLELTADLWPDVGENYIIYTFENNPFDLTEVTTYDFRIYHEFEDANPDNDELIQTIEVYGYPVVDLGEDIYTLQPDTVVLDAGEGFVTYLWQDGITISRTFDDISIYSDWYSVTVTDDNNCPAWDSLRVTTYDIEIADLVYPEDACLLTDEEYVKVRLINHGPESFDDGDMFAITLKMNSLFILQDTIYIAEPWNASESLEFEFTGAVNMEDTGEYEFEAYMVDRDANTANDTLITSVEIIGYPDILIPAYLVSNEPDTLTIDAGAGYETYTWSDPLENISYDQTINVTMHGVYTVSVTNELDCESVASTEVVPEDYDLILDAIVYPTGVCFDSEDVVVSVRLYNNGQAPVTDEIELEMGYRINDQDAVIETAMLEVLPDRYAVYHFSTPIAHISSEEDFNLTTWLFFEEDLDNDNDTLGITVEVYPLPVVVLGEDIYTTNPTMVILDAGDGFAEYLWQDSHDGRYYDVTLPYTYEYSVSVTDFNGCPGSDNIMVIAHDITVEQITSPVSDCELGVSEILSVEIKNVGPDTISSGTAIPLSLYLNSSFVTQRFLVLEDDLRPDEDENTIIYTFDENPLDMSAVSVYEFRIYHEYRDADSENDELIENIEVFGYPVVDLGDDIYTTEPTDVILDAGEDFTEYLWQDGHDGRHYNVTLPYTYEYSVEIIDVNGCPGSDNIMVIAHDISVDQITSPVSDCLLSNSELVTVLIKNVGPDTISSGVEIPLSLYLNGTFVKKETIVLTNDLWPDDGDNTISFTFSDDAFDLSGIASYEFRLYHEYIDADPDNDELAKTVEVYGFPEVYLGEDIYTALPDTIVLDAGAGFAEYLWHEGFSQRLFNVSDFGLHWVMVTDEYGCFNSDTINIINTTSVESVFVDQHKIYVYPNPANDHINIMFDVEGKNKALVYILDMAGNVIKELEYDVYEPDEYEIFIGDYKPGLYLIRVVIDNQQTVIKFIKR